MLKKMGTGAALQRPGDEMRPLFARGCKASGRRGAGPAQPPALPPIVEAGRCGWRQPAGRRVVSTATSGIAIQSPWGLQDMESWTQDKMLGRPTEKAAWRPAGESEGRTARQAQNALQQLVAGL
jgi:hypothetical protein